VGEGGKESEVGRGPRWGHRIAGSVWEVCGGIIRDWVGAGTGRREGVPCVRVGWRLSQRAREKELRGLARRRGGGFNRSAWCCRQRK
jgi:hypothetical protein